jgi:hypothetical protein
MKKLMTTLICTSHAAHFEGIADALEQYRWHRPMRHVQGYPGNHWTPPLGKYSLRIVQVAARATSNKTMAKNGPALLAISIATGVRQYNTVHIAQSKRSRASLEASGHCHRATIAADSIKGTWLHRFFNVFHCQHVEKGHELSLRPLFLIRVLHIKQKKRAYLR